MIQSRRSSTQWQDRPSAAKCLTGTMPPAEVIELCKPPASPARRKAETFTACRGTSRRHARRVWRSMSNKASHVTPTAYTVGLVAGALNTISNDVDKEACLYTLEVDQTDGTRTEVSTRETRPEVAFDVVRAMLDAAKSNQDIKDFVKRTRSIHCYKGTIIPCDVFSFKSGTSSHQCTH